MKQILFLKARGPAGPLHARLLERFAPDGTSHDGRVAINLVTPADASTPWDAVVEIWSPGSQHPGPFEWKEIDSLLASRAAYEVTELVEKDTGPPRGWPTAGVKLMVPWIGREDVAAAAQRRHWDEHVPLANRIHVGVTRYVRNWVEGSVAGGNDAPPYQGIATQYFLSEHDLLERSFDSPASVQVILDDVADFIAQHVVLRVTEYFSPPESDTASPEMQSPWTEK